jgi:hypothetical protein
MVLPVASRSLTPITTYAPASLAASPSRRVVSLGTTTAWSANISNQRSSPSQIRAPSIQIGVPGRQASGSTTRSAARTSSVDRSCSTLPSVASRSISTYAACTAATLMLAIPAPPASRPVRPSGLPRR